MAVAGPESTLAPCRSPSSLVEIGATWGASVARRTAEFPTSSLINIVSLDSLPMAANNEDFPIYEPPGMDDGGPTPGRDGEHPRRRGRRGNYALTLQRACAQAMERVKENSVVANSNWAAPLTAAPSAISTMATLLKAADKESAAGLEIESQDVKDAEGILVGKLPNDPPGGFDVFDPAINPRSVKPPSVYANGRRRL